MFLSLFFCLTLYVPFFFSSSSQWMFFLTSYVPFSLFFVSSSTQWMFFWLCMFLLFCFFKSFFDYTFPFHRTWQALTKRSGTGVEGRKSASQTEDPQTSHLTNAASVFCQHPQLAHYDTSEQLLIFFAQYKSHKNLYII